MYKLLIVTLTLSSVAFAEGQTKKVKDPRSSEAIATETEHEFSIPVPQSEIKLEAFRYKEPRPVEIGIAGTTWVPENLTRSSYTGKVSRFEKGDMPNFSVNAEKEFYSIGDRDILLSAKMGITYFDMVRSASRDIGAVGMQRLNFLMARVGMETTWAKLLPWRLEPVMSFALLPTWLSASKSQYEGDIAKFGLPYEATAGLLWRVNEGSRSDFGVVTVGVSGQAVSGTVAGSSLKGFGFLGELRVSL